jgi:hypothetical protein
MSDWLSLQTPEQLTGLVSVLGAFVVVLTAIITAQWKRVRCEELRIRQAETEAALKQEMIQRGMSADEIVRVLESGVNKPPTDEQHRLRKDTALMQQMIDNGMSADEIVRVLETARKKAYHPAKDELLPARKD